MIREVDNNGEESPDSPPKMSTFVNASSILSQMNFVKERKIGKDAITRLVKTSMKLEDFVTFLMLHSNMSFNVPPYVLLVKNVSTI